MSEFIIMMFVVAAVYALIFMATLAAVVMLGLIPGVEWPKKK